MTKLLFALLFIAVWKTDCEGAPNEDQAEKSDLAMMKKELILLREEMEKEKISNAEFRNANAKRQKDDTRELVASEIDKYFANSRICDMGSYEFHPDHTESGKDIDEFKIIFEKAFPRMPKAATAIKQYEKGWRPAQVVSTYITDVTRTSAKFTIYTEKAEGTVLWGTWIACM